MRRTIKVFVGDEARLIGTNRHDAEGSRESSAFEYDADWLVAPDGFAIDPALPLVVGPHYHRKKGEGSVFHAAIADTAPDGWGRRVILRDQAKQRLEERRRGQTTESRPMSSLDFLLAVDDLSRVGALRFQDEQGIFQRTAGPGRRTAPPLIELGRLLGATRAVETNSESAADLAYLRGHGTSLGGMRPKCSVLDDDGRLSIGKFPSVADTRAVTKGEVLALRLASRAGIAAAAARLVESAGTHVAVIRRFDRRAGGGRIMYVSAATMVGADPGDPGEHTYTELVDALRVHGAAVRLDLEQLWRRIVFSILITSVDDHLCNHGFLHVERGLWRLSPAFDLNPFPERARELKTWISEEAGPEATLEAALSVTGYFGIPPRRAREIVREVDAVVSSWRAEGRALGMSATELDPFADAFEHREREAARRIAGT